MVQSQRLPLHDQHASLGAKFMEFAGWEVPLQYSSIVEEHHAVRKQAGVFDVSHMGKFVVRGKNAAAFIDRVFSNGLHKIGAGRAIYGLLLNPKGGVIDDIIVYQSSPEDFFIIVNAATLDKDFRWMESHKPSGVEFLNESAQRTILAVQGPESADIIAALFGPEPAAMKPFRFMKTPFEGTEVMVASTGYTGEKGFEIVAPRGVTPAIFEQLLGAGMGYGLKPAGFGARDTLRLEARYHLYGQDMDDETTALEADLEWVLDFTKDFIGRDALEAQKKNGAARKLAGFTVTGAGVARHGHEIHAGGKKIGIVTSGTYAPTLQKSIGLGYVPAEFSKAGTEFEIMIRDRSVAARVTDGPFYSRP